MKYLMLSLVLISGTAHSYNADVVSITEQQFGAVANDGLSDHVAIQKAIDFAIQNKKSVYIPSGTFEIGDTLDFTNVGGLHNSQLKIFGEKRNLSKLITNQDISVLKVSHGIEVHDLTIEQTASFRQGKAIDIDFASYKSNFSKLNIIGFDKGIYGKWIIWNRLEDIFINNVNIGIELHENGDNPGYWNTEPNGWFNNVNVFDNVYIEKAETGFKLAAMGSHILNSTVQSTNTAVEIFGPKEHVTWNNQITNFYVEGVKTVFKVKNSRYLGINGVFAQGGSASNRAFSVIDAENAGTINISGMTGQDWWQYSSILKNTHLIGQVTAIGGIEQHDIKSSYSLDEKSLSTSIELLSDKSWVQLPERFNLKKNTAYKVTISGLRDGYEPILEQYSLFNWSGLSQYGKIINTAGVGRVKLKIEQGKLFAMLDYYGGNGLSGGKITLEKLN